MVSERVRVRACECECVCARARPRSRTAAYLNYVTYIGPITYLDPRSPATYFVRSANVSSLTVRAYAVTPELWEEWKEFKDDRDIVDIDWANCVYRETVTVVPEGELYEDTYQAFSLFNAFHLICIFDVLWIHSY